MTGLPSKFTALDKSQHILAAATGSQIVFWDLRKMKQRSTFTGSFSDTITHLRFDPEVSTNLFGCSLDGMISMMDLTQTSEE
jgi:WD40 repeat protein